MKHLGMKKTFQLHLIRYSLLSVVIPIRTFSCGFVRLKVQEVIFDNGHGIFTQPEARSKVKYITILLTTPMMMQFFFPPPSPHTPEHKQQTKIPALGGRSLAKAEQEKINKSHHCHYSHKSHTNSN